MPGLTLASAHQVQRGVDPVFAKLGGLGFDPGDDLILIKSNVLSGSRERRSAVPTGVAQMRDARARHGFVR